MNHVPSTPAGGADVPPFGRWTRLALPTLFFLAVIYYEEFLLKLFCFGRLTFSGALFTLLFTIPIAALLGLLCGGVSVGHGRILLPLSTALLSLWMGGQTIYYRLFKTFTTLFSLTKVGMVAGAFGGMAMGEILMNWVPVVLMTIPLLLSIFFRKHLVPEGPAPSGLRLRWAVLSLCAQLLTVGLVMLCGRGTLSPRYVYLHTATPELETQHFGMMTQTRLELNRLLFGIAPDDPEQGTRYKWTAPARDAVNPDPIPDQDAAPTPATHNMLELTFDLQVAEGDKTLESAIRWFSQREPTAKNEWTGYFEGKNLVWIVAEGFSTLAMDPERTPTLWQLSHQGFVFENFYTPLWGVSTSDGEYVTTTGLIPKSGVWSYSQSSENYMPFALGNQFQKEGYRTMAFHNYLYDYYDRNLSHPNMGYEYYGLGQGLTEEDIIPAEYLTSENTFPPSDEMMMDTIVPMFVNEDQFMIYCLTVSGHLNYTLEENNMAAHHWDSVKDLPYSDAVKCYLASQMELELAVQSLVRQLEEAGKLEDTVIVLSADHYPYGLTDEEYSELLGHAVDPVFEIYENTLILWSADMEAPVYVEKYCSSLDVMPTLSNLFGLEYDSRLVIGRDILSDSPGLVIFSNYSFLHEEGCYNSISDQYTRWDGQEPQQGTISALITEVQNRVACSAAILDYDYYRLLFHGLPNVEVDPSLTFDLLPSWLDETRLEFGKDP